MGLFNKDKKKEEKESKEKEEQLSESERIGAGQVYCRIIVEMLGKPKEHIESALKKHLTEIKKDKNFSVVKEEIADTTEVEGGMFSTFVELEMWISSLNALIGFCFDYMPSSIEILKPERISYSSSDFSGFLNDLQAKLHNVDMLTKNLSAKVGNLEKNSAALLKNLVVVALAENPLTLQELSLRIGIPENQIEPFLKQFTEKNILKKDKDKYSLPSKK